MSEELGFLKTRLVLNQTFENKDTHCGLNPLVVSQASTSAGGEW